MLVCANNMADSHLKKIKLIHSLKGSGRSGEYLLVELEGTARYVGLLLNHVEGFGLLSSFFFFFKIVCIFFLAIFGFKTHFQLIYAFQS